MTARAQHADFAAEAHEKFGLTVTTHNPRKPVLYNTTLKVLFHRLPNNRPQRAVLSLEQFLVHHLKPIEMLIEKTEKG